MIVTLRELMQDGESMFIEHAVWQDGTYKPKLDEVVWTPDMKKLLQKVHVVKCEGDEVPEGTTLYLSRWFYPNNDGKYSFRLVIDKEISRES